MISIKRIAAVNVVVAAVLGCSLCVSVMCCCVLVSKVRNVERRVSDAELAFRTLADGKVADDAARTVAVPPHQIEVERKALHAAYQVENADFYASHGKMGGGRFSYAMLHSARETFMDGWRRIVTNWFYSTARSELEKTRMKEYDIGVEDLKYTRDELNLVMCAWKSISSAKGKFQGMDIDFKNGVAVFTNTTYECSMELRLCKDRVWVEEGSVFAFARSDVAGNDAHGASDALMENWFLRFRAGRLVDSCHFRHGCDAFDGLRFDMMPINNRILVTSTESGNIVGELTLGLREYTDQNGQKSRPFKYSEEK